MIPRISLLPWRREQRIRRARWFLSSLAGTGLSAAALVYAATVPVQREVDALAGAVATMRLEADRLRKGPPVATRLREREAALERLRGLRTLESDRDAVVQVMTLTLGATPPGIVLTDIVHAPGRIDYFGWAVRGEALAEFLSRLRDWHSTDEVRLEGMGGDATGRRRFEVSLAMAAESRESSAASGEPTSQSATPQSATSQSLREGDIQ